MRMVLLVSFRGDPAQGREAALTHTNRHTGRASTVLRLGWLRCPADLSEDGSLCRKKKRIS